MPFPSQSLVAIGGTMYSHIFENAVTGLSLGHFWSLTIDYAPIDFEDRSWKCSLSVEWLQFPVRDWRRLNNGHTAEAIEHNLVESSFYLTQHDWAETKAFSIQHSDSNKFNVKLISLVDFKGFSGDDAKPKMQVNAEVNIEYVGLYIQHGSLFSEAHTSGLASKIAEDFVDITAYHAPEKEGFRYCFRPKWQ